MGNYYWEKNLDTIRKYRTTLVKALKNCEDSNFKVEKSKGDPVLFYDNKSLYSLYGPKQQVRKILDEGRKDLNKKVILVFGFGLGYLIEEILDNTSKETIVISVNPDSCILIEALKHRDLSRVLRNPRFVIGILDNNPKAISSVLTPYINNVLVGGMGVYLEPSVNVYRPEFFKSLKKELIDYLRVMSVHFNTLSLLEFAFVQNTFFNTSLYVTSLGIQIFKNVFKNVPAIVVSAGPSLNKNIDQIKYAKGKALIIALGPTFKPLLKHGVIPDFVVAIDPVDLQVKMFEGVEEETKDSILVTVPYFNYKALNLWKGKIIWFGKDDPLINFFDEASENPHDKIDTGMTVAHTAFSFANYIGSNPIILVGQDLSYPTDKTHVDGAPLIRKVVMDPKSIIWVEGNYEEKVPTVKNLFSFIYLFEEMAERIKKQDSEKILINATEGGAKIEGFEVMTFEEVFQKFMNKRDTYPKFENLSNKKVEFNVEKLFTYIDRAIIDFYSISKITYELIKEIKTLPNNANIKDIEKLNRRIQEVQREVVSKKYFNLMKLFFDIYDRKKARREIGLAKKYKNKKDKKDFIKEVEEQKKKSITYYSEIFTIANFYGNMMEFVRDKIKEKIKSVDNK